LVGLAQDELMEVFQSYVAITFLTWADEFSYITLVVTEIVAHVAHALVWIDSIVCKIITLVPCFCYIARTFSYVACNPRSVLAVERADSGSAWSFYVACGTILRRLACEPVQLIAQAGWCDISTEAKSLMGNRILCLLSISMNKSII
jgi:hypothetical protein